MAGPLHSGVIIGLVFGVMSLCWTPSNALAQNRCVSRNLSLSALQGDAAEADWLSYRNPINGLAFLYPPSMRVEERNPATFHFDVAPEVIVDLKGNEPNNPNVTVMRFICAAGRKTPEMAAGKARALLKTRPESTPGGSVANGAIGAMQIDGHEAIVSCGCGRAACHYGIVTLQPYECRILPMVTGDGFADNDPPPHDGEFPLLSIIKTVHFESVAK